MAARAAAPPAAAARARPRPPARPRRRAPAAAASGGDGDGGVHAGAAFLHLFVEARPPGRSLIETGRFKTFLDCNLHCLEVERYHPAYLASASHASVLLEDEDKNAADLQLPYFNLSVYEESGKAPTSGGVGALFEAHLDFVEACEIAHQDQVHVPMTATEVASVGTSGARALAEFDGQPTAEGQITVLALLPKAMDDQWQQWSGADACAAVEGHSGASLYAVADEDINGEGDDVLCRTVLVAEYEQGALDDDAALKLLDDVKAAAGPDATVGLYQRRLRAKRGGVPVGAAIALVEKARADMREDMMQKLRDATKSGEGASAGESFFSDL